MNESEQIDVVDDDDNLIRSASRRRVHDEYLIHRSVIFFIFDEDERVFVNQRSRTKDLYPGVWSIACGGHVLSGESYDLAASREIEEETGLREPAFFIAAFQKRTADERENVRVYGVQARGELTLFADEIEQGQFMTLADVNEALSRFEFLPETPSLLKILLAHTARRLD